MDMEEEVGDATPSVMARLSAVSLTEISPAPRLQHDLQQKQNEGSLSLSSMEMSNGTPLAMECSHHPSAIACTYSLSHVGVSHCQEEALLHVEMQGLDEPCWAELLPDALAKIFSRLSLKDILCTIPCVCQYWQCVSQDAACWQNIDLLEWSCDKQPKVVERLLLLLVNRSQGGLRRVCVPNLKSDSMLELIARRGSQLKVLRIPDSFVSEECLCELAPNLTSLTYLDISGRFPSRALLESFGKHCKSITRLNLNMRLNVSESKSCDIAALAIAEFMPQLTHLEMAYGLLSNVGLKALLESCTSLEHLDLRGCWHLYMDESLVVEARKRIREFLLPVVEDDIYDLSDSDVDEDDDDLDLSDYVLDEAGDYLDLMSEDFDDWEEVEEEIPPLDEWYL